MPRLGAARLWPAAAFQFTFIAAVAMLKPGANALVLARFQPNALPWLYMAAAAITGGLAAFTAVSPRQRSSPGRLALAGAVSAVAFAAGVWKQVPLVSLGAYLFAESFATQVSLAFWGSMGEAFDSREARRAFTWINGVGMAGAIAGGLAAQVLARALGTLPLLVGGGVLLFAGAVAWRFHRSALEPTSVGRSRASADVWARVVQRPYERHLAVLVISVALISQLTDYVFRHLASEQLQEAAMADLFASHQLWTGVFCVAFQFLAAETLLRRVGILRYAALVPAVLLLLCAVALVAPTVWSAFALKLFESAASWSMLPVAMQLLYAPLPDEARDGVRHAVDGFLRKGGVGLAGLILAVAARTLDSSGVLWVVIAVCAVALVTLFRMRAHYVEAVHERVAGVQAHAIADLEERLLFDALKSPTPERALRAVELLEHAHLVKEDPVRLMLVHPHERVQEKGVRLARAHGFSGLARQLELMIAQAARRPRDEAVWTLAQLAPQRARVVLPQLLEAKDVGLLCAAVGGLLSMPGEPDPKGKRVLETLLARGARAPAAERREVARLLGRLGDRALAPALGRYLDDSDTSVRRVAITGVGEGAYLESAPKLLRFLSWRDERRTARDALARLGDPVVGLLAQTLDDRSRALSLRVQLPRVLRLIGTPSAFGALFDSNARDEAALHYRVGVALSRLVEEHPEYRVPAERVRPMLERRRQLTQTLVGPYRDLRAALGDGALLTRVVGDRLDQAFELSFWILGLAYDAHTLRRAHAHLTGGDGRRRAWALELIENTLAEPDLLLVREALDRPHRSRSAGDAAQLPRHLGWMCTSDDSVLRACARRLGRAKGLWKRPPKEDDMSDVTLERLFALEGVEIFAQSDVDDLAAVAAVAKEQRFRPGATVYHEGDPGDALYVIVDGRVEARSGGEAVMVMKSKESFGETSLFDGAPRINDVVAAVDTRVLVIDRRDFLDLLADRPELLSGMFRVMSRQLKSVVQDLAALRSVTGEHPIPQEAFDDDGPPVP